MRRHLLCLYAGLLMVLVFSYAFSAGFATDTGWQYWNTPKTLSLGQSDQSADFVTNIPLGTVDISYIDVYMAILKVLPGDATFVIVVMYGPIEQWFNPADIQSSNSLVQGIRVVLSPSANCGMTAGDFRFTVLFAQKDISYEPASWRCIMKLFHDIPSFQSTGSFHLKLAYAFESSNNGLQQIMLNPTKPPPKMDAVFSVTAQTTTLTSTTTTFTALQSATVPISVQTSSVVTTSAAEGMDYRLLGSGLAVLAVLVVIIYAIISRKEDQTRVYDQTPQNSNS